ncbi:HIG2A protein, partial [Sitta europaea]|nr:HIG2A protein [Sitta europaea]
WNRPGALSPGGSRASQAPSFPAGCLCTVGVLAYGIICFKKGNTRRSQLMMRARVLAQGFTFAALLGGMVATAIKSRQ